MGASEPVTPKPPMPSNANDKPVSISPSKAQLIILKHFLKTKKVL